MRKSHLLMISSERHKSRWSVYIPPWLEKFPKNGPSWISSAYHWSNVAPMISRRDPRWAHFFQTILKPFSQRRNWGEKIKKKVSKSFEVHHIMFVRKFGRSSAEVQPNQIFGRSLPASNGSNNTSNNFSAFSLQGLIVNNNKLVSLPEEIGKMSTLMLLDASCNEITHLPVQIGDLASLKTLNLRRNHLQEIPIGIK